MVVAPTSSGKTMVGELAAVQAVLSGRKAVFLLPSRALVNENSMKAHCSRRPRRCIRVVRCSGDATGRRRLW